MTTTQDLRALIARLQARLGEGTQGEVELLLGNGPLHDSKVIYLNDHRIAGPGHGGEIAGLDRWRVKVEDVLEAVSSILPDEDAEDYVLTLHAAALNELPGQIARWLARLDEAEAEDARADNARGQKLNHLAIHREATATTLLATVTEDVQAWAVRLGVGDA